MSDVNPSRRIAVVLFNLGGPDDQASVKPFLFNLFNDPAIIGLPGIFRTPLAKLISSRRETSAQAIERERRLTDDAADGCGAVWYSHLSGASGKPASRGGAGFGRCPCGARLRPDRGPVRPGLFFLAKPTSIDTPSIWWVNWQGQQIS